MSKMTEKNNLSQNKAKKIKIILELAFLFFLFAPFAQASSITIENVISQTNKARKAEDVAALTENAKLDEAAKNKAADMIKNDYFAHISPTGKSPWEWIIESGYDYRFAGENLAINFTKAEDQQNAWMDSPLHRKNVLNGQYEEIGVAVEHGKINGIETIVTVQMFGTQVTQVKGSATANIAPTVTPNENKLLQNSNSVFQFKNSSAVIESVNNLQKTQGVSIEWGVLAAIILIVSLVEVATSLKNRRIREDEEKFAMKLNEHQRV